MAIKDLVRPELPPPTPAAERPPNITCEKYTRGEDGKRCIHFQQGGTCALPDEFVCTEWQKHNGPNKRTLPVVAAAPVVEHAPAPKPVARDLFGNPLPELLVGSPDTISAKIEAAQQRFNPQETFMIIPQGIHPADQVCESLGLFADKVMPRFS